MPVLKLPSTTPSTLTIGTILKHKLSLKKADYGESK